MSKQRKESKEEQRLFWQMAIETWQGSGLSVRQFCRQEGLSEPSFYSWRKRLERMNVADSPIQSESEAFIEVSLPTAKSGSLELVLSSGNTLKIPADIKDETLFNVISILKQVKLC